MAAFTGSATASPTALTRRRASKSIKPGSTAGGVRRPRGRRDQGQDNRAGSSGAGGRDEDRAADSAAGAACVGMDYSSPVLANGKIYFLSRSGEVFVYAAGPEFKLLGQNRFASDGGDFSSHAGRQRRPVVHPLEQVFVLRGKVNRDRNGTHLVSGLTRVGTTFGPRFETCSIASPARILAASPFRL